MIDWASAKQRLREGALIASANSAGDPQRLAAIRRERAARLAERKPTAITSTAVPVLVFRLNCEQYGVELTHVIQVLPFANCTPIPGARSSLLGVINLRGEIRSVVDLGQILRLPPSDDASPGDLILLRQGESSIGARVDRVECVRQIVPGELLTLNEELTELHGCFAAGMTSDKLIMLRATALFANLTLASQGAAPGGPLATAGHGHRQTSHSPGTAPATCASPMQAD